MCVKELTYLAEGYIEDYIKAGLVYPKQGKVFILKQRPIEMNETFDTKATPSLFECALCKWECSDTYACDTIKYCPGCGRRVVKVMVLENEDC